MFHGMRDMSRYEPTLQKLQRNTKLAVPRLPLISLSSWAEATLFQPDSLLQTEYTYCAAYADDIWMYFAAGRALHLAEIRVVICCRAEIIDALEVSL